MIDYNKSVSIALKSVIKEGYSLDNTEYNKFKELCDYLTFMSGMETESLTVDINKSDNTVNLKIGTYFFEIEDMRHVIFEVLKHSSGFKFYTINKDTDDAMLIIDIKFKGFLIK